MFKSIIFACFILLIFIINNSAVAQKITDDDIIPSEKNPALAFACSFVLPGLGELYNEEVGLGLGLAGISTVSAFVFSIAEDSHDDNGVEILCFAVYAGCWVYSIIDSPITAKQITDEARIKKARRHKKLGCIDNLPESQINISINPVIKRNFAGVNLKIEF